MEPKSRVKKYESLRNTIETEHEMEHRDMTTQEDVLKAFDSTVFKKAVMQESEEPKHAKNEDGVNRSLHDSFTNEYLDDFMKEVREYNIRKGNRGMDSTEVDILSKIQNVPEKSRSNVVSYVEEEYEARPDDDFRMPGDIAKEVAQLFEQTLSEEEERDIVVEDFRNSDEAELIEETFAPGAEEEEDGEALLIAETISDDRNEPDQSVTNIYVRPQITEPKRSVEASKPKEVTKTVEDKKHEELVEETQKMKKAMADYEAELNDLSTGVEKNSRLLNTALGVLIILLLAIIGVIVYAIYQAGGFGV